MKEKPFAYLNLLVSANKHTGYILQVLTAIVQGTRLFFKGWKRFMITAERLIAALGLQPLPLEGGYFRETYRADRELPVAWLGPGYGGPRSAATAIYYLLTPESYSALHRLPGTEVFHFYLGDPVEMLQLDENGTGRIILLGQDVLGGQVVQTVVAGKVWQGSRLRPGGALPCWARP